VISFSVFPLTVQRANSTIPHAVDPISEFPVFMAHFYDFMTTFPAERVISPFSQFWWKWSYCTPNLRFLLRQERGMSVSFKKRKPNHHQQEQQQHLRRTIYFESTGDLTTVLYFLLSLTYFRVRTSYCNWSQLHALIKKQNTGREGNEGTAESLDHPNQI
jgi:hypothetical protein